MSDLTAGINNKAAITLACRIPVNVQEKLMILAVETCIGRKICNNADEIKTFSESSGLSVENVLDLIGLYISVVRVFMESDEKQFHEAMSTVGFSEDFVERFPLKHNNVPVSLILSGSHAGIQKLSSFKWRVDISFAIGVLKKQIPPSVIISLQLDNGKKYIFEVDLKTFHRLRFNIALAFKEFNILKSSSILKNRMLL